MRVNHKKATHMICMPDLSTTDVLYLRPCVDGGYLENNKRCHTLIHFDSYGAPTENVRINTTWSQILDICNLSPIFSSLFQRKYSMCLFNSLQNVRAFEYLAGCGSVIREAD